MTGGFLGICLVACAPLAGSFAGFAAWRLPRGLDWVSGRSRCESCSAALTVRDLVPILSWLALRGGCRHCGRGITVAWTMVESGFLAVAAASAALLPGGAALAATIAGWGVIFAAALAWSIREHGGSAGGAGSGGNGGDADG